MGSDGLVRKDGKPTNPPSSANDQTPTTHGQGSLFPKQKQVMKGDDDDGPPPATGVDGNGDVDDNVDADDKHVVRINNALHGRTAGGAGVDGNSSSPSGAESKNTYAPMTFSGQPSRPNMTTSYDNALFEENKKQGPGKDARSKSQDASRPTLALLNKQPRSSEQLLELSGGFSGMPAQGNMPIASRRTSQTFKAYARENFQDHKKGFLRKEIPKEELMAFSKVPIKTPLLRHLEGTRSKDNAVKAYRHLMSFMGDLTTNKSPIFHIREILKIGIADVDVRDEIFCQICKQTTDHPDRLKAATGWQAMALCAGIFSPSIGFQRVLEAHLEKATEEHPQYQDQTQDDYIHIMSIAACALRRLKKVIQSGTRKVAPDKEEIDAVERMESIPVEVYLPDESLQVSM
ncbi:hypothetical protein CBR_g11025 [Chara braunii]|uniref:MyTH4 domain-containing protein n=1 Tax=Chara braunii TaxID=69332 RepID=A0A388KPV6_CHABU|nr:hypothetical protein CBR_g11025 [Chara braunii]|eukprot:GBG72091.1 hypothetical protein CBR_g11025 [Chara braunii]